MPAARVLLALTRGVEPQRVIRMLNGCMTVLSDAVDAEGGVVDEDVGDQIMAVFGAPLRQPDHARRPVAAALRMRAGMDALDVDGWSGARARCRSARGSTAAPWWPATWGHPSA